ncbi:ABC transporter ATP-binding protein [Nesterenkonia lutea]|uniref:Multidrug/hemolysin transport system ATP-binding protein n=1 Tax=Nesterenkonia lutea TaxID=272919 RepID=A0ABR9JC50_9MICC|nr:ABC transporter ATP-binding protein [Nesterenkonia lutea]MBE1523509.1 multidrug/hemolysin transport system ATP-binding protein [Nesterenkonia lutea]
MISVSGLTKRYGSHTAVDDLSFDVDEGSTFAFLGTNGAGKSTTISCLTTLKRPTSGEVSVLGHRVGHSDRRIRRSIGVVFQDSLLDPILSVRENLLIRGSLYGMSSAAARRRMGELSEVLEVEEFLDQRYGSLSGGQRRRADIVRALLHDPKLLFLDEPTTGLDPDSRERVWDTVTELQRSLGLTIFLTTHYMEETERADQVFIIDHGRIVASGTPSRLRAEHSRDELRLTLNSCEAFDTAFSHAAVPRGAERSLAVEDWREAMQILKRFEPDISDFEFRHGTMDDVFLNITRGGPPA